MVRKNSQYSQRDLIQIGPLPQVVPSRTCLHCDVCCRFPEPESFLRPYFTREEIERAVTAGLDPASFPSSEGGQVRLVPSPTGEGYLCPAFDPETHHCRIYEARPLDCQIYPLALMWSEDGRRVLLGWDEKCPFVMDSLNAGRGAPGPDLEAYADEIAAKLEQDGMITVLERNLRLIGPYQEDVVVLRPLDRLTERLGKDRKAAGGKREAASVQAASLSAHSPSAFRLPLPGVSLTPLTLHDRARVEAALLRSGPASANDLSAYAFAPHMIWRALLPLSWAELDGHLCLFAESADGVFMVLPPLGPGPLAGPLQEAFRYMGERNRGAAVSRVENVSEELREVMEDLGYHLRQKDPDYLYRTIDLVNLAGDRYKSQRAACNQLSRRHRVVCRPFRAEDGDACRSLLDRWTAQKADAGLEPVARAMLADAGIAHRDALGSCDALGLIGRVLLVDDALAGYTFGYRRSPRTICVLLEVADRTIGGAAQVLFREFAKDALAAGHEFINTLDASGLGSLAASKEHYRPVRLVPSYIATQA